MGRIGLRRTLAALAVSTTVAACGAAASPVATTTSPSSAPIPAGPPRASATPAVADAAWVPAGSLALGRASTHAALLGDGRVLVVGNDNRCMPGGAWEDSARAEVYDPAAGSWAETGSLNAPRDALVAVALPDGRVLVAGGLTSAEPADGVFGAYSSAKLYDPANGTWSPTALMGTARTEAVAALLPDGTVLVAGGVYVDSDGNRDLASAEIYDPETGTWSRTGDMGTERPGAQAVTLADGRVLVVGGPYGSLASAEIYDPATGGWTPAGSLAQVREDFALVALPDGGALVAGGSFFSDDSIVTTATTERFDPGASTWSKSGEMLTAAASRSAVVLGDGRVLVAGGISAGTTPDSPGPVERPAIANAELYDPATGAWTATTPLPEPREGGAFVTLVDRSVLLVGGDRGYVGEPTIPWCPEPLAEAVRYVPANVASFPPSTQPPAATVARSDVPRATAKPADAAKAAASIAAFGIDLYRRMLADGTLDPNKNAVFSPTSIALALAMARAGANGETAAQMDEVLHTSGWDALGVGLNALDQDLASRDATWKDDRGTTHELALRMANAAFAQQGWPILQGYLDRIAAAFGSGLRLVDYIGDTEGARRTINAWVGEKTQGRIPELLEPAVVRSDNRLWLVNAIYLKANWAEEFEPAATAPRSFTRLDGSRAQVPTMSQQSTIPYATGSGWKATELRYQTGDMGWETPLAMTLILPDDLAAFERQLTAGSLQRVVAELDTARDHLDDEVACEGTEPRCCSHPYDVNVFLPRFTTEWRANLVPVLQTLGMELATTPVADFSGITSPSELYIAAVIHQANIDVDEKGTTAAAATAVGMSTTGGCGRSEPLEVITVRLDRPFLFVLRDVETGAILFMGRVVDPSAKS